ncbi:hypothetical protein [Vulcanisaeta thermophila]|uniref:hypothetical protein n=1 Tax=Vulcanisaeta thermophila TaxID=867917 RepID=UPI000A048995|nr:hypothetical protein [Vulcanisaeta thermophila]
MVLIEELKMRRVLWLAIRKHLVGDYGDLSSKCEAILIKDPRLYIIACVDDEYGEYVRLTIKYNPLDVAHNVMRNRNVRRRARSFVIPIMRE